MSAKTVRVGCDIEIYVEESTIGMKMLVFDKTLRGDPAGISVQLHFTRAEAFELARAINSVL